MKLTLGIKLTFSFLFLAFLVVLSGSVGIFVLNQVSISADTVVKEKVPAQYSIMKANLAVERLQKAIADYNLSTTGLAEKEKIITSILDELEMWIFMLDFGTSSKKFRKSVSYDVYKGLKLDINVPKSSEGLLKLLSTVKKDSATLRIVAMELVTSHKEYLKYSYVADGKSYDLPLYILVMRQYISTWYTSLESVVVSVTRFEKNTDPAKGPIGIWLNKYRLEDKVFKKQHKRLSKYHTKLLTTAKKINDQKEFEGKDKLFKRSRGNLSRVNKAFEKITEHITPTFQALNVKRMDKSKDVSDSGKKIRSDLDKLVRIAEKEMSVALKKSETAKKNGVFFLIILTVFSFAIALALGMYMRRYMTKSITALANVTKMIAQGELTNKVDIVSNDELGDLAKDTNSMSANLRNIISQITNYSTELTKSSFDLSTLAVSLSEGAQNMTGKSESVAAASEEMSSNMNSVAVAAEETSTNINTVTIATDEINSSINEIAKNSESGNTITQEAVVRAESATIRVNKLGEAATEISAVTEVISEISAQTNLLALNATIEAARAGEAGKGFAVVASEIKQLALKTAEATNDIKNRIEGIQNSTSDTVEEIEGVATIIENVKDIVSTIAAAVEEQSVTTKEISKNMGQASSGLHGVTENVTQSSTVASEIARDIGDVNISSNEMLNNSELINKNSEELKIMAENIQELVNQFKL